MKPESKLEARYKYWMYGFINRIPGHAVYFRKLTNKARRKYSKKIIKDQLMDIED